MADDLAGLQLIGNLLAYPKLRQNQAEQERMNALGLQLLSGRSLEEAQQAVAPVEPPGKFGQTIGGIGSFISTILGNPIKPPRVDLGELGQAVNVADTQRKRREGETAAARYTNPAAQAAARAGQFKEAEELESGIGPAGELPQLIRYYMDQNMPVPQARAKALEEYNRRYGIRAGMAAGIQTREAGPRAAASQGAQATQRRQEEETGQRFIEPYLRPQSGGEAPTPAGRIRNIGYSVAADTPQGQFAGMVPSRATKREGTGEVAFENPAASLGDSNLLTAVQAGVRPGQMPTAADVGTMRSLETTEAGRRAFVSRSPTRTDLLILEHGIDPTQMMNPEQAATIGAKLDQLAAAKGVGQQVKGQLARIRQARVALQRLLEPAVRLDPNTGQPLRDAQGNPVFLTDAQGRPMRAVDVLTSDPIAAMIPWWQALSVEYQRKSGNEAASLLQQGVGEVAGFVRAAGDTGNAAEKEQATQLLAFIPNPSSDTMQSAVNKVVQGLDRLQRIESELKTDIRENRTGMGESWHKMLDDLGVPR